MIKNIKIYIKLFRRKFKRRKPIVPSYNRGKISDICTLSIEGSDVKIYSDVSKYTQTFIKPDYCVGFINENPCVFYEYLYEETYWLADKTIFDRFAYKISSATIKFSANYIIISPFWPSCIRIPATPQNIKFIRGLYGELH